MSLDAEALLNAALSDPMYRLTGGDIYKIFPGKKHGIIPYKPRPEHLEIFKALIERDVEQLMLLKARRPGFSTAIGIYCLDFAIFNPGVQISLLDQNAADASKKLDRIIGLALDNVPEWLRRRLKVGSECGIGGARNGEHLSVMLDNGTRSDIYAGMNARGGTNDFLWLSEAAVIQHEDPPRSAKIRSGALPSARDGKVVVESTWAGGKHGDIWDLIKPVIENFADDWELQFCPWWRDPRNTDDLAQMDEVAIAYFEKMDPILAKGDRWQEPVVLTEGQKRWWAKEKRKQGSFQSRENPSTISECWEAPVPGAIYAECIDRAHGAGRVGNIPVHDFAPVHTAWDLGAPLQTVVWYFQAVGDWINVIDCDRDLDFNSMSARVDWMRNKPYRYGSHFMPHDEKQTMKSGRTLGMEFSAAWLKIGADTAAPNSLDRARVRHVNKTHAVEVGINHLCSLFPSMKFRTPQCQDGLDVLKLHRRGVPKDGQLGALAHPEPVKDWTMHTADALRTLAEAHLQKMITFAPYSNFEPEWQYPSRHNRPKHKGMKPIRVGG